MRSLCRIEFLTTFRAEVGFTFDSKPALAAIVLHSGNPSIFEAEKYQK
jgi:hypothetical protein